MSIRNPNAEANYQEIAAKVIAGNYDFSRRWLFARGTSPLARLIRYPTPRPIYNLKTNPELNAQDIQELLKHVQQLAEGEHPVTLNYTLANASDISGIALAQGWLKEAHVRGFDTILLERNDLEADPAAKSLALEHLQSPQFAAFYKTIWQADVMEQKLAPFEDEIANFIQAHTVGEVIYLYDDTEPVAVGVLDYEGIASMTLIGVLPQHRRKGWGTRLHRHLMWLAKQHVQRYRGQSSVDNAAMLRLFHKNGCTHSAEVWQLIAPENSKTTH